MFEREYIFLLCQGKKCWTCVSVSSHVIWTSATLTCLRLRWMLYATMKISNHDLTGGGWLEIDIYVDETVAIEEWAGMVDLVMRRLQ